MTKIIKIDIDLSHKNFQFLTNENEFISTRIAIVEKLGYKVTNYKILKSKHGYHIYIYLDKDVTMKEMIKMQFLLGDDVHRVTYNIMRLKSFGEKYALYFNILFAKKFKRKKK